MIPGVGKAIKDMDIDDTVLSMVLRLSSSSMTPKERTNP
jgi:hypothetical protein